MNFKWDENVANRASHLNLFEGGRRLLKIAAFLWLGWVVFHFWEKAGDVRQVWVTYSVPTFNGKVELADDCPVEALAMPFAKATYTDEGTKVLIKLCFLPIKVKDELLIPYKIDSNGQVVAGLKYRPEVDKYIESFSASFSPPESDYRRFDDEGSAKVWDFWKRSFLQLLFSVSLGVAVLYGLSFLVGWVLRGFLGIPRGMDKKP